MRKACQFITPNGGGCRIYEDRPANCRGWTCEWLAGAPIRKPTESGVIFFAERTKYGQTVMVGARTDEVYEDEKVKEEIQRYRDLGYPVLLMHDDGERTLIE
jgi:Fe-S-cluster containining protein